MNPNISLSSKVSPIEQQLEQLYARREKVDRLIRALQVYAGRPAAVPRRKKAA